MRKLYLFFIVFIFSFFVDVSAKDVQVFFITEGGSTNTNGFKIIDDYVNRTDGTYCATYKSNGTINKLNSINGASFSIYKSGTNLVSGREWYTYNYSNNKLYYFNQNNSYNIDEVLQKLSMRGDPYPVISLFAHWKGDGLDDGIDIGGTSKNVSSNNKKNSKKSDKIIKIKSISISGSSRITKGKSTTLKVTIKPSNAKKETITWSSSNSKIVTVNSSGKVTGISKGTATIIAKTSSGKKSTFKVSVVEVEVHKVKISYNMNGGKLSSSHSTNLSASGNDVILMKNNNKIVQTIAYGSKTSTDGLSNYNNPKYLNIERSGYIAKKGAEWNTKSDGTGKSYSDKKVYKASDFCNAKDKDCNVTLYVNWVHKKNSVYIKFNMNGGRLVKYHGKNTSVSGNKILCYGKEECQHIEYGKSITPGGLFDYNNNWGVNILRENYVAKSGAEWNTKPDGTGKSYSQKKIYKSSDFCNASKKDCSITLYVNWVKTGNNVIIKYNLNGGHLASVHGKNTTVSGNQIFCYGKEECQIIRYGKSITAGGLYDYNNKSGFNIVRSGFYITNGFEWNTKPDGTGKSYNQKKIYKSSDFCNAKDKDCSVTLYANWKAYPMSTKFEILYWLGPSSAMVTDQQVNYIKDAGFTTVPLTGSNREIWTLDKYNSSMKNAIEAFGKKKIKVLVTTKNSFDDIIHLNSEKWNSGKWVNDVEKDVNFYSKFSNVIGYHIMDEPNKKYFNKISKLNQYIKKYDPKRFGFTNLLPGDKYDNMNVKLSGTKSYYDYIGSFTSTVKPKYLSFDRYPGILGWTSPFDNPKFNISQYNHNKKRYYNTFKIVRNTAYKNGNIPMAILLVVKHDNFRNLSHNEIAFQASLSLAFGMKSISYFTYSNWGDGYALMDSNYNPTQHYYDVKKINKWVYPIGNELYNKKVSKTFGFNEVDELEKYNNKLGKIKAKNDGILTIFNDNSFMLVNTDLVKNTNNTFTFDDKTTKLSSMEWFNPSSSRWEVLPNGSNIYMSVNKTKNTISIPVGHCVLLRRK